jgi:hypothetical protein
MPLPPRVNIIRKLLATFCNANILDIRVVPKSCYGSKTLVHLQKQASCICRELKMRYQTWDVLVFPDHCKIPLQEFKTSCQVIQDPGIPPQFLAIILRLFVSVNETNLSHRIPQLADQSTSTPNCYLLHSRSSFWGTFPCLYTLLVFQQHCNWNSKMITVLIRYNPELTRYVQHLKKPTDIIVFEARVFIDGKIAG